MKVDARFRQLRSWCCRSISFAIVLAMAFCLAVPFAGAQSTGGRIRGTVVDPSGGAVPAANVTLRNEATGGERTAQSSATGEYVFLEVPVGTYTMELQLTGFKKYLRKGVTLELNQILTLDITLQIGGSTEVVEVTGAPPVVDTTSTQLGAVVNRLQERHEANPTNSAVLDEIDSIAEALQKLLEDFPDPQGGAAHR